MWRAEELVNRRYGAVNGSLVGELIGRTNGVIVENDIVHGDEETIVRLDEVKRVLGFDFLQNMVKRTFWKCVNAKNVTMVRLAIERKYAVQDVWDPRTEIDAEMISILSKAPKEYNFLKYLAAMDIHDWPTDLTDAQLAQMLEMVCKMTDELAPKIQELRRRRVDTDAFFATLTEPPWRLLFATDYAFSDSQWKNAAQQLVEESRTNFTAMQGRLDQLAIRAMEQGKQNVLRQLLHSTQHSVTSENFKRKRQEITHTLDTNYRAVSNLPLVQRIKSAFVIALQTFKPSLKDDFGWDVVDKLQTFPWCADLVGLVFDVEDVCDAIKRGKTRSLSHMLERIELKLESLQHCRPKNKDVSSLVLNTIHHYARVLGTFPSTLWPSDLSNEQRQDLLLGVLQRANPRIVKSESDVNMLVSNGAQLAVGLASIDTFHYTIALTYAVHLSAKQLRDSIRKMNVLNPQELNALIGIIRRVAVHFLEHQPNATPQRLVTTLRATFDKLDAIESPTTMLIEFGDYINAFRARMNAYSDRAEHVILMATQIRNDIRES